MGLNLNDITDAEAAESLARCERDIARWEESGPDEDQRRVETEAPRYYEVLADLYFKAGALAHQQERPRHHVQHYLHFAGVRGVEELEHRRDPGESTYRDYYKLLDRLLGSVACFCPMELRARVGALHESRYHWPHDPKWKFVAGQREIPRISKGFFYRLEYMRAAIEALSTGAVNVVRVQALIRELDNDDRQIAERIEAGSCYWALMAIADRNHGFFNQTVSRILELHRSEAQRGRYRQAPEGLLCMNALLLGRLAREADMQVSVYSDYMPVALLG